MRVTQNTDITAMANNLYNESVKDLKNFLKVDPEKRREIATLICSIYEELGRQGLEIITEFTKAVATGDNTKLLLILEEKEVPLSLVSNLLALGQELEAHTRENIDKIVSKAKRGAIELTKLALSKAVSLI